MPPKDQPVSVRPDEEIAEAVTACGNRTAERLRQAEMGRILSFQTARGARLTGHTVEDRTECDGPIKGPGLSGLSVDRENQIKLFRVGKGHQLVRAWGVESNGELMMRAERLGCVNTFTEIVDVQCVPAERSKEMFKMRRPNMELEACPG